MNQRADRPTMQDVADRVGVSKALVSLVFRRAPGPSEETAGGIHRRRGVGAIGSTAPRL